MATNPPPCICKIIFENFDFLILGGLNISKLKLDINLIVNLSLSC